MNLVLLVYFASIANGLKTALFIAAFLFAIAAYFSGAAALMHKDAKWKKLAIAATIAASVLASIAVLIPREKTIYIMAGAYATEQIASNDRVQKIGSDVLDVIEKKLGELKEDEKQ